jgi:hypothetical protein
MKNLSVRKAILEYLKLNPGSRAGKIAASLSGGLAVLIDERGIDQLGLLLTAVNKFDEGTFINLLEMTDGDVGF